jgi:hypothetical protein
MTTHKTVCWDNNNIDRDDSTQLIVNKDVLRLLQNYVRPKLWVYWIHDPTKSQDVFKYLHTVEAESYDDVCVKIFNDNIQRLVRSWLVQIPVPTIVHIKKSEELVDIQDGCIHCSRLVGRYWFCPDHFPSNEILLKYMNFTDDAKCTEIDNILKFHSYVLKIKELEW